MIVFLSLGVHSLGSVNFLCVFLLEVLSLEGFITSAESHLLNLNI